MAELPKDKCQSPYCQSVTDQGWKITSQHDGSKRPAPEVRESFVKLQNAYEKLVVKHEDVTQLIETDKELAKEEEQLEESLEMFIR